MGDGPSVRAAADNAGLALTDMSDLAAIHGVEPGCVYLHSPAGDKEPVQVAAIRQATQLCLSHQADALVTGPIHKAKLAAQGFGHKGHTDLLGEICQVPQPVMAFVGGRLKVALVTTHIPLSDVPKAITVDRVVYVVRTAAKALQADLGISAPRIAVCGLNPHAGEGGLLGTTEQTDIGPACAQLRDEGRDIVVAMYHDQGLVPLKIVDFGRSVNWTLGLPIIRTSVDHGTADDLYGTGRADPASMAAAIGLAQKIVAHRRS
jgi:4-hydroxythreonine-4-phosphate dehydrogenase